MENVRMQLCYYVEGDYNKEDAYYRDINPYNNRRIYQYFDTFEEARNFARKSSKEVSDKFYIGKLFYIELEEIE